MFQTATANTVSATSPSEYSQRAIYASPTNIFKTKRPPVPAHIFITERDQAFAADTATGLIDLDLSEQLGYDFAATTPFLLARYARIRSGEQLPVSLQASGEIYYVIRGEGESSNQGDTIAWHHGDIFCFPGGAETVHSATSDSVLYLVTDEPLLSFAGLAPANADAVPIEAVHYPVEDIERELDAVIAQGDLEDASGKAIQFLNPAIEHLGTCLPTIALAVNSLQAKSFQRPHIHNSVALTLCTQGEGCYSLIDGERVDWQADAVMVTPPTAVHSHHNDGNELMTCLIAQDGGLYYHAQTIGFEFSD